MTWWSLPSSEEGAQRAFEEVLGEELGEHLACEPPGRRDEG